MNNLLYIRRHNEWKIGSILKQRCCVFAVCNFVNFLLYMVFFFLFSFAVSFVSYFSFSDQNGMDMTILQIMNYFPCMYVCMNACIYIYVCMFVSVSVYVYVYLGVSNELIICFILDGFKLLLLALRLFLLRKDARWLQGERMQWGYMVVFNHLNHCVNNSFSRLWKWES